MSLVVPPEYAKDISNHSGYLNTKSKWAHKSLKGLWRAPENVKYLSQQLFTLVTYPQYVHDHLDRLSTSIDMDVAAEEQSNFVANGVKHGLVRPVLRGVPFRRAHTQPGKRAHAIAQRFRRKRADFAVAIPEMIEEYVLPYSEDQITNNPVMQLHYVNMDFLTTSANVLIQHPEILDGDFRYLNPDTEEFEDPNATEYQYSAESWNDGTWHPEHLFTSSQRNRDNPYWKPLRVEFWSGPIGYPSEMEGDDMGGRGPGNRYKHTALPNLEAIGGISQDRRGDDRGIYNLTEYQYAKRKERFSRGGQFPFWQTTVHDRPHDRDISETLSEGGLSDRRTQLPHGYDMSGLTRRSGQRKYDIPRQTHYGN